MNIPSTVYYIGCSVFAINNLTKFTVASGSRYFSTVDGVLFSKDGTQLISYANGKTSTSYTVPSTVDCIQINAFGG